MQKNYQALEDFLQENKVTYNKNRPFKECTSFSVGGIVDLYVTVKNIDELLSLLVFLNKNNIKYFVIKLIVLLFWRDSRMRLVLEI